MAMTIEELRKERNKLWQSIVIEDYSICYNCKTKGLKEDDQFCPNCRFPQRGTQQEMKKFISGIHSKQLLLIDKEKAIRKARNVLYILAAVNFGFGVIFGFMQKVQVPLVFVICAIVAAIYFGLALWSTKKPFAAIISGFFVYIVFIAINAIADPHTLYQGLLWKVLIISAFVYGYIGARDSEQLEKDLIELHNAKDLT